MRETLIHRECSHSHSDLLCSSFSHVPVRRHYSYSASRVLYGLLGPREVRFTSWFPLTSSNLRLTAQDVMQLARLRVAERAPHESLAALVQGLGMLAFIAIAATGVVMALYLVPGSRATEWLHDVKQTHEPAQQIIPVYRVLYVGGVVVHALFGQDHWRSMFLLEPRRKG